MGWKAMAKIAWLKLFGGSEYQEFLSHRMAALNKLAAAPDLLSIARMAADGKCDPDHARAVLERHGLVPGKDER